MSNANVTANAYYVPVASVTGDFVPDWFKLEYFGTTSIDAMSDTDLDGFDLGTEYIRGYHPSVTNLLIEGGVSRRRGAIVEVLIDPNLVRATARSRPAGIYGKTELLESGTTFEVPARPQFNGYQFTGWFTDGGTRVDSPNASPTVPLRLTVTSETLVEARFVPSSSDTDGDGLLDALELFHFSHLSHQPASDPDGDGYSIATELARGYEPMIYEELIEGGVSRRRGQPMLIVTDPSLVRVVTVSEPAGIVDQTRIMTLGATLDLPAAPTFIGYDFRGWFLGMIRVDDSQGFSSGTIHLPVNDHSVFVARFLSTNQDTDADGIRDAYEFYHFNQLANDLNSDPDGDGFNLQVELSRNYHPNILDEVSEGGVARRRGDLKYFIPPPPEILLSPVGANVTEGSSVTLQVNAKGIGTLTYQWRLNGVNLDGETNATIVIGAVGVENSGSYSVAVASPFGATNSAPAVVMVNATMLGFSDEFSLAQTSTEGCRVVRGSNVNSSRQVGEPSHDVKPTKNSVWRSWRAPGNGVVTMSTRGSSFDTVFAVYTGESMGSLTEVASDDDGGEFYTSVVRFSAVKGTTYRLVVDGLRGETGEFLLSWCLETSASEVPRITAQPASRTVARGATVPLHVQVVSRDPVSYQWYFNGEALALANTDTLSLEDVKESDVGKYQVAVWVGNLTNWSRVASLQIGRSESHRVEDKVRHLFTLEESNGPLPQSVKRSTRGQSLGGSGFNPVRVMVSQGLPGVQSFGTYGSKTESQEVNLAGEIWHSGDWIILTPTQGGVLSMEARGDIPGVGMAAYAMPGGDFQGLSPVASDTDANGTCEMQFPVTVGMSYLIGWATKSTNARKIQTAWTMGSTPMLVSTPVSRQLAQGSSTSLKVWAMANQAVSYQWRKGGVNLAGENSPSLQLTSVTSANAGVYDVVVSSGGISVTNDPVAVGVITPTAQVSGRIRYYVGGHAVPGVSINAGESGGNGAVTSLDGSFALGLNSGTGQGYVLTPQRISNELAGPAGVSTLDITLLRRHILGIQNLSSAYAVLAADANGDRNASTVDIFFIRRWILAMSTGVPGAGWVFVRDGQTFPDLRNPWSAARTRVITGLSGDLLNQDFIAIRVGDVNGSWPPPVAPQGLGAPHATIVTGISSPAESLRSSPHASSPVRLLLLSERSTSGERVRVRLVASGFEQVTTAQFTLEWDGDELVRVEEGDFGLPGINSTSFGRSQEAEGKLTFSWDDPAATGVTVSDGTVLFSVEFALKGNAALSSICLGDTPLAREVTIGGVPVPVETRDATLPTPTASAHTQVELLPREGGSLWKVKISVPTSPGKTYALEASSDLRMATWQEVDHVEGDGWLRSLTDDGTPLQQRFYRVRVK